MYLDLKKLPLWPSHNLVQSYMPKNFRELYSSTCEIIDATEIFIDRLAQPELQQTTFSSYRNHNTYKALLGSSPGGILTFVSKMYSELILIY